jgi:hypothetical protein
VKEVVVLLVLDELDGLDELVLLFVLVLVMLCVECVLVHFFDVQEVQNLLFLKHMQRLVLHFTPGLHGQHRGLWIDLSSEDQLVYITGVMLCIWFSITGSCRLSSMVSFFVVRKSQKKDKT